VGLVVVVSYKVSVPSPEALAWDACSMTHLEIRFPMH
jgi:hypothetical protein